MIAKSIRAALQFRWLVLILAGALMLLGGWLFTRMKIDAYPDISAQMVQVITTYPGRAPEEVERQVTLPVEIAMRNVPKVETIRSRTIFGLSLVQLIFEEGTESYWARQRVQEKLTGLELPAGALAELGPLATAYGEVLRYELVSDGRQDLMELRTLNDWVVIPRLLRVPGVAEVSNFGGYEKQFAVLLHPAQLQRYGLSVNDVADAIQTNNASAGGSVLSRGSMSFVIRGRGSLQNAEEIGTIFVKSLGGTPIYIRDVADVQLDSKVPAGIFSKDFKDEAVEGIVLLRKGENPSDVLAAVQAAITELNTEGLPPGVRIEPYYDRSTLVESTLHTVGHSVMTGIGLVILILLAFLGRPSLAALVALTIPFALLFALVLMYLAGIPIGLLSIGAIDFGIIVDGAVVMAENIARRLDERERGGALGSVMPTVLEAALEVERPVFFSLLMILGAFLPLLTLTHIEGLLFRPMALTIVFALGGALLSALFVVPVLATFFYKRGFREWHNPVLHWLTGRYRSLLTALIQHRKSVVATAGGLLASILVTVVPRLGMEFLPYMDEGVIWVRANFPEGTSLQQTARFGRRLREIALEFPDIQFAVAQTGRNDSGTDPYPPSRIEMMLGPKPRETWTRFGNKHELLAALGARFREEFPTTRFNFTQPIIDSVTEDTNGTSANLAIEFSGPDSEVLLDLARKAEALLKRVPGATDVNIEQEGPQPQLLIEPDRSLCARYNVRIEDVTRLIDTAIGGSPIGTLYEGERRFDIVTRFSPEHLLSPQALGRLPVYNASNIPIPLAQVARIGIVDGQTMIARADGRRRLTVRSDIVGRDQGGFVADAQARFEQEIRMPAGYHVAWLGMYDNLQRAKQHFALLVPVTIGVIYLLLLVMFRTQRVALILLTAIPFAFIGGVLALYVRGMNVNVSAGVGFAAVFGVSIMDGVLLLRTITSHRLAGVPLEQAIIDAATRRFRPILITALVAILGLVPASLATGLGSDVQRPVATVIVWGLFSATMMTLLLIPVLYRLAAPSLPVAGEGGAS
ncbi:heavy metal efflux pump, CzcA family [Methylococcus capsulatus str. Bath]|jgi:cobalt-zinc-cadmium resistance protein CzcA|uniref:Heavy metal efflux pump, CzcA family n=1 Tax=Methylococcus capsulatus (strain ATCC 33009 / NCIMB 11132 / Bath) TaxID=243233 RepID=Q605G0_METCA|nr:CusA/CzcA family heavy metal efflux RND transporter [Methylococcus capsulatus]AAU91615.1 heavy metal efflux pump, CzcA family [Methylococcus capsulatus str. Bath]